MNELKANIITQMYAMNQTKQTDAFKTDIKNYQELVGKVETLEKELELLDEEKKDNNKDLELQENNKFLEVSLEKAKKQLVQNLKKKDVEKKALAQK